MTDTFIQYLLTILEDTIPYGWYLDSTPTTGVTTPLIHNNVYSYMSISIHSRGRNQFACFYNKDINIEYNSIQLTFTDYEKDKMIVKSAFGTSLSHTLGLFREPAKMTQLEADKLNKKRVWTCGTTTRQKQN